MEWLLPVVDYDVAYSLFKDNKNLKLHFIFISFLYITEANGSVDYLDRSLEVAKRLRIFETAIKWIRVGWFKTFTDKKLRFLSERSKSIFSIGRWLFCSKPGEPLS